MSVPWHVTLQMTLASLTRLDTQRKAVAEHGVYYLDFVGRSLGEICVKLDDAESVEQWSQDT